MGLVRLIAGAARFAGVSFLLLAGWGYVAPALPVISKGDVTGYLIAPRIGLRAPVRDGDSEGTLRKGLGWIPGSNAIAGHRDTYFRPLRSIRVGDELTFESSSRKLAYWVTSTGVVEPTDIGVLGDKSRLTLITCFPFDFVGHAPQRFVVQAERMATLVPRQP